MFWRRLFSAFRDVPQRDLNVGAGTALGFTIRIAGYALAAITGIVVARALGANARGVYALVTTVALTYAAFSELGLSQAGVWVVGQKKGTLKQVLGNNFSWLIAAGLIWSALNLAAAAVQPAFLPDGLDPVHYLVFAAGGIGASAVMISKEGLLTAGSILGSGLSDFLEPFLRCLLIVTAVVAFSAGVEGVLIGWTLAILITLAVSLYLLSQRVELTAAVHRPTLRRQLSFGFRGYLGWVMQSANYRLDVFLVVAFVGATELGYYAVAFGAAELLWQIPFALGAVFFPKVSAMSADENAEMAAITCRRALFVTLVATICAVALGQLAITVAYGEEFSPAVVPFYILAPSALLYTIQKVLSSALAGRGMPEATLYGGLVSVPVTVVLGVILIPTMGIEGAAIASVAAYAANAACIMLIFAAVTGKSPVDVLVIKRNDVNASVQTARTFLARSEA
jgi:O-antigen/teichoic acid export membrane protein